MTNVRVYHSCSYKQALEFQISLTNKIYFIKLIAIHSIGRPFFLYFSWLSLSEISFYLS